MKDNMTDVSKKIVAELCNRVGAPYPAEEGKKYEVYDYEWTHEDEDDFRKWLEGYLLKTPIFKRLGKKRTAREIDWVIFQYSWKIKGDGNGKPKK